MIWQIFHNHEKQGLQLRLATDSDFHFICDLVCHPDMVDITGESLETMKATLDNMWGGDPADSDLQHFIVVQKQLNEPIAYLRLLYPFLEPECLWLSFLVVAPIYRGQGYGKKIMNLLITAAQESGQVAKFGIHTMADNVPAIKVYESSGFTYVKKEPWQREIGVSVERLTFIHQ